MPESIPVGIAYEDPILTNPQVNGSVLTAAGTDLDTAASVSGATAGTAAASKAVVLGASLEVSGLGAVGVDTLSCTGNVGTAATGVTATEQGDGYNHVTFLAIDTTLGAIAGGAALGLGKLLYTLPAGVQMIEAAYMNVAITQSQGNITADTPEVGLGTVVASGAVSVLSGTATFENILTGQVATDCNGTPTVKTLIPTANVPLIRQAGDAKTIYFNVADNWAASGDAAAAVTGDVTIVWRSIA